MDSGSDEVALLSFIDTAVAFGNGPAEPWLKPANPVALCLLKVWTNWTRVHRHWGLRWLELASPKGFRSNNKFQEMGRARRPMPATRLDRPDLRGDRYGTCGDRGQLERTLRRERPPAHHRGHRGLDRSPRRLRELSRAHPVRQEDEGAAVRASARVRG